MKSLSSGTGSLVASQLRSGAAIWGLIVAVYVLVNGPVLDETLFPGMIIARAVHYPPGDPNVIYFSKAYSLFSYIVSGMWRLLPDPGAISALRSWFTMWLNLFAVFAACVVFTRKAALGYGCAALAMWNTFPLRPPWVTYPIVFGPYYASLGQNGLALGVLAVVFSIGRMWLLSGLLLGLLPAVHAGIAVIIWPWAAIYLGWQWRCKILDRRRFLIGFFAGIAVCFVLAIVVHTVTADLTTPPPVVSDLSNQAVYDNFERYVDVHRPPMTLKLFAKFSIFAFVYFALVGLLRVIVPKVSLAEDDAIAGLSPPMLILGVLVWGFLAFAYIFPSMGMRTPFPIQAAMPGRDVNIPIFLSIPLATALGWSLRHAARRRLVRIPILWIVSAPLVLYAAASRGVLVPAAFLFAFLFDRQDLKLRKAVNCALAAAAILLLVGSITRGPVRQWLRGIPDPVVVNAAEDRELRTWLAANSGPDEPLVTGNEETSFLLQARLARPILVHDELIWCVTYMPNLAGSIGSRVKDIWGIDYSNAAELARLRPKLDLGDEALENWNARSVEQWQLVGAKYGFRFVVASNKLKLRLPIAVSQSDRTLYVIP